MTDSCTVTSVLGETYAQKQIAALLIAASSLLAVPAARADNPIANALIEQGVPKCKSKETK